MSTSKSDAKVTCTDCGGSLSVPTNYFRVFGEEPFCEDCRVHTRCQSCERGLRLMPSRYRELGGEPVVCTDCAESTGGTSGGSWFWDGLTIGEKIVFPICLLVLGLNLYLLAMGAEGGFLALPSLLFTAWIYSRGRRAVGE